MELTYCDGLNLRRCFQGKLMVGFDEECSPLFALGDWIDLRLAFLIINFHQLYKKIVIFDFNNID